MGNKLRQLARVGHEANARREWATSKLKKEYKFEDTRKALSQEDVAEELKKQATPDENFLDNLSKLMKSSSVEAHPAQGVLPKGVEYIHKDNNMHAESVPGLNKELDQMEHINKAKLPSNRFKIARQDKTDDNLQGKLTGDQMNAILVLHTRDPAQNTADKLAPQFNVDVEQIRVLLSFVTIPRK